MNRYRRSAPRSLRCQRGVTALLMLTLLCGVFLWQIQSLLAQVSPVERREEVTRRALADARSALLAWSVQNGGLSGSGSTNLARPGAFPCPDSKDPASDRAGYQGDAAGTCTKAALRLGRIAHRTMLHAPFLDGSGERLWMAVVEGFEESNSSILNPDFVPKSAWFQAWDASAHSALTAQTDPAVVVIFAPGVALPNQKRGTAADKVNASNYLESASTTDGSFSNLDMSKGAFVGGDIRDARQKLILNDRVAVIRRSELMQAVSLRALRDYQRLLEWWRLYKGAGKLPHPARFDDPACVDIATKTNANDCVPDPAVCRGRLPKSIWLINEVSKQVGANATERFKWLYRNRWEQQFYYSVNADAIAPPAMGCSVSSTIVTTSGTVRADAIMVSPGWPLSGQARSTSTDKSNLANYLEAVTGFVDPRTGALNSAINQQGWQTQTGETEMLAVPALSSNDRIYRWLKPGSDNGFTAPQWFLAR
ncbi:hypothetical protein [Silvimonas sp.]|uniref:hypothetical protein n=1 Tax=Silvimonas sp. TaxID=2650811 RepID=UPI0028431C34|nr:hypothetical protein [Silvimonas sp.]MDR3425904.1 hypothetical protein [Silvimonas sp.]